jgi:hypothetical protein
VRELCPEELLDEAEVFYPLHVRLCEACLLVQLPAYVSGEHIFLRLRLLSRRIPTPGWRTRSATREAMTDSLRLTPASLVTEVASNDGYLLQHFQAAGIPVLGVEPAANVAEAARAKGIPTEVMFLGAETGRQIAHQHGRADLVAANNVFAHVPDIRGFAAGAARTGQGRRHGDAGIPAPAPPDRAQAVRHDLSRALLVPVPADLDPRLATAGLRVVDVDDSARTAGRCASMPARRNTAVSRPSG